MHAATMFVMGGLITVAAAAIVAPRQDAKPLWHADFAAAQEQARRKNRPIFAVLHCGH